MKSTIKNWLSGSLIGAALLLPLSAQAGKIVVNHDEWTISNTGFSAPNDPGVFMDNVVRWFTGGGVGTVHAYSDNFSYNQSSLATALGNAGHTYTTGVAPPVFDLVTLQTFDAVFLGGQPSLGNIAAYSAILIAYVNTGGNVYIEGGTGSFGGAANEALAWNPFLNAFGLDFASSFNNVGAGNLAINNPHPIFAGVDSLYHNNGNSVTDLDLADPRNQVLVSTVTGSDGLYAIWDSGSAVPEPGTVLLLGFGLLMLSMGARRRI